MIKIVAVFLFSTFHGFAQPYYTRLRAAVGGEALGIAPTGQVYSEASFAYRAKTFWNISTGLGAVQTGSFRSYTLSSALTYSSLLNPYMRRSCQPRPGYNSIESYFETGVATFFVDTYNGNQYFPDTDKQRLLTPLALAGLRIHFVSSKWIYILKLRYTPALLESKLASKGGIAFAIGWR